MCLLFWVFKLVINGLLILVKLIANRIVCFQLIFDVLRCFCVVAKFIKTLVKFQDACFMLTSKSDSRNGEFRAMQNCLLSLLPSSEGMINVFASLLFYFILFLGYPW